MSELMSESIVIKLVSRKHGARHYKVNPNHLIASLWKIEGVNSQFFMNGKKLLDKLTFKYYSITDGSVILAVAIEREFTARGLCMEKLRLDELYLNRLLNSPRTNCRLALNIVRFSEMLDKPIQQAKEIPVIVPSKSERPNDSPLPMMW